MTKFWHRKCPLFVDKTPFRQARRESALSHAARHPHILAGVILLAVFSPMAVLNSPGNAALHVALLQPSVIEKRLEEAPKPNAGRELALRAMFEAAGCRPPQLSEQTVRRNDPPNLVCEMPGKYPALIIVGGHLDHVRRGEGVVDDWSGASMLPSLYESLHSIRRKHTFLFIGFTDEEKGLVGSHYYVRQLPPRKVNLIRAAVNLECLGMNSPEVWADHANARLLTDFALVSRSLGIPLQKVNVENIGRDDAESFRKYKVPTITIHSLTQDTLHVMHSPADNFSAIHMPYYYESYRLVADYLAYLDADLR
ncbi:MAG TPA: M28 family peptidase [Terriglobia bacterium]|nr:M28 family peptidase [Terriglobia bacterium]